MSERRVEVETNGQLSWTDKPWPPKAEITISGSTWIVVETAVYHHTIFGPFAGEQQAAAAVTALESVSDGHHEYVIHRLEGFVG